MGKTKKKKRDEFESSAEQIQQQLLHGISYDDDDPNIHKKHKMKKKNKHKKTSSNEEENDNIHIVKEKEKPIPNNKNKKEKKKKIAKSVSIAIAGSIIDNAQSLELATRLAGQIARAATIFRVDEVVVFDNKSSSADESRVTTSIKNDGRNENDPDLNESGAAFLIRILQLLETPQYLRKSLIPKHPSLRVVGLLPPLDAPHHLRKHEWGPYREGVTLRDKPHNSAGTLVDVGLSKNILINQVLDPGIRVTVSMGANRNLDEDFSREVVSPSKPKEEAGLYWGYKVRYASNITAVFKESPYKDGYDHVIGTSEHGQFVKPSELSLPPFRHLLIAFGGLAGLEEGIEEDTNLKGKKPQEVFHSYFNTCPNQGSRTIRSEEAIFISLQYFQEPINRVLEAT